jgi:hypothetical protein
MRAGTKAGSAMSLRAILIAPLILAAVAAADPPDSFTSGVWQGKASYDDEGHFSDCTMTAQAESDVLLGFVISKDFDWGLVIADDSRSFEVGASKAVLLLVDGRDPIAAMANVVDVHGILIPLDNSAEVVEAMRAGKVLRIATGETEFSFQLTGTSDAISELATCVTQHQGTSRVEL